MNKRSMKKGFPVRLLALLLCCFCLLSAIPTQVLATEGVTPPAQEEVAPVPGGDENATASQNLTTGEAPKTEEPKTEAPKSEEPKTEEPKTEEPKTEEPKMEEPKTEEPKTEEPKTEEPKTEEPKTEEPKTEEPKTEEPKTEEPKTEEPKTEEPKTEEPKTEEPKTEEPKTEEPKTEEPKTEEPKTEEPKTEEPKTEEPKTEEPKTEEPTLSLYDRLMACKSVEEMNAILDNLSEEENAEMDAFTEEQENALSEKLTELGYYDLSTTNTVHITNEYQNAEVAYVEFVSGRTVTEGDFHIVTNGTQYTFNGNQGALIFFVKPTGNYLLTQFRNKSSTSTAVNDLYGVNAPIDDSNVQYIKSGDQTVKNNAQQLMSLAASLGYVGYYGFTYTATGGTHVFEIIGQQPKMTVSATANPSVNVKPQTEIEFTVTVTPGSVEGVAARVTGKRITSMQINGQNCAYTENADGTYTVKYTVSREDWMAEQVELSVTAELDYEYVLGVEDSQGFSSDIATKTTITASTSADVKFASQKGVVYQVTFAGSAVADSTMFPATPNDTTQYFEEDTVFIKTYNRTPVDDPVNGGTWSFSGWDYNAPAGEESKTGLDGNNEDTLEMPDHSVLLEGVWTFTKYPTKTLTVTKNITGNMQDPAKTFTFKIKTSKSITYDGTTGTEFTFTLGKGGSQDFTIPVGTTVTVTEDPGTYTPSYTGVTGDTVNTENPRAYGTTFVMPSTDCTVTFTNDKTVKIETAVNMDFAPYVLLLTVAAFGALLLLRKRRVV